MLTILSSPKPFVGDCAAIQRNAIRSWLALDSDVEIVLYGRADGAEEISSELGIGCVPDVPTNRYGTPLFPGLAAHAEHSARHDTQVYVNCDILLPTEFLNAACAVNRKEFLMIGQRIDLEPGAYLDVVRPDWLERLRDLATENRASVHPPAGSDYFVFRRGMWSGLRPVAIGRLGYDNALIAYCLRRRIPVVDATWSAPALHQYHACPHTAGGEQGRIRELEAQANLAANATMVSVADASRQLRGGTLVKTWARGNVLRAAEVYCGLVLGRDSLARAARFLWVYAAHRGFSGTHPTLAELLRSYAECSCRPPKQPVQVQR